MDNVTIQDSPRTYLMGHQSAGSVNIETGLSGMFLFDEKGLAGTKGLYGQSYV